MNRIAFVIHVVYVWLLGHPDFDLVILWPMLTALINSVFKEAETHAGDYPRLTALKALLESYGVTPKGTIALLKVLWTGKGLPPPKDPPSGDISALAKAALTVIVLILPVVSCGQSVNPANPLTLEDSLAQCRTKARVVLNSDGGTKSDAWKEYADCKTDAGDVP